MRIHETAGGLKLLAWSACLTAWPAAEMTKAVAWTVILSALAWEVGQQIGHGLDSMYAA